MLRSAAKNFARVAVATDPAQYAGIVDELDGNDGTLSARTRFALSVAAFNRVAQYDACIRAYLSSLGHDGTRSMFPGPANGRFLTVSDLRSRANPPPRAPVSRDPYPVPGPPAP